MTNPKIFETDVIQVEQINAACCKKLYTSILLWLQLQLTRQEGHKSSCHFILFLRESCRIASFTLVVKQNILNLLFVLEIKFVLPFPDDFVFSAKFPGLQIQNYACVEAPHSKKKYFINYKILMTRSFYCSKCAAYAYLRICTPLQIVFAHLEIKVFGEYLSVLDEMVKVRLD